MTRDLPVLVILAREINDVALDHMFANTGLRFRPCAGGYSAQPEQHQEIVALFLTYNFKTQYQDNNTYRNTMFLKFDHHTGFHVDSICFECCKRNYINTNGLKDGDLLAC